MPRYPASAPVSLPVFYATHFGHLGVVLPFLPPWLLSLGLAPAAIGGLLALLPLAKLITPWTWGRLADRSGWRRGLLVVATLSAAVWFFVLGRFGNLPGLVVAMGLYAICLAPGIPFIEATTLEQAEARGFAYGRVRLWGSMAFAAMAAGYGAASEFLPSYALFPLGAALLGAGALTAAVLPPAHRPTGLGSTPAEGDEERGNGGNRVGLVRLLLAATLMQASHGAYYTFYSIRLENLGFSGAAVGLLWALAVVCEVILLTRIDDVVDRVGTITTLRLSLIAAAIRWLAISAATGGMWLGLAQGLHALTYAAFHVAALREVYRRFGPSQRATGQALYSGLSYGLGFFGGTLAAGFLAGPLGLPAVFRGSAAVALAALIVLGGLSRREDRRG